MSPARRLPPLALVLIAGATFAAIAALGLVVSGSSAITASETDVVIAVNGFHSPVLDAIAQSVDIVFGPRFAVPLAVVVVMFASIFGRSWSTALRMALLVVIPWGAADIIKVIIQRPRPDLSLLVHPILTQPTSFSYPSGHTAFAVALGMSMVVMVGGWRYRAAVIVLAAVMALTTAWSRMYLGAHYPSDVLGSLLLVSVWSLCIGASTQRGGFAHREPREGQVTDERGRSTDAVEQAPSVAGRG